MCAFIGSATASSKASSGFYGAKAQTTLLISSQRRSRSTRTKPSCHFSSARQWIPTMLFTTDGRSVPMRGAPLTPAGHNEYISLAIHMRGCIESKHSQPFYPTSFIAPHRGNSPCGTYKRTHYICSHRGEQTHRPFIHYVDATEQQQRTTCFSTCSPEDIITTLINQQTVSTLSLPITIVITQ